MGQGGFRSKKRRGKDVELSNVALKFMETSQVSYSGCTSWKAHLRFQGLGTIFIQDFLFRSLYFQENLDILKIWARFRGKGVGDSFLLGILWIKGAKIVPRDFSRVSVVLLAQE